MRSTHNWKQSNIQKFWAEHACEDHLLQIYENETAFMNALEGFAGSGFLAGESVIIIGSGPHLKALNSRLIHQQFDINKLIANDQYLPLDAEETLENFMVKGAPDPERFNKLIAGVMKRAGKKERKVRAFGEMVAILWAAGNKKATHELEALWNSFCAKEKFCLFCAYPKTSLTNNALKHICSAHTKMISGESGPSTQVSYREIEKSKAIA